MSPRAAARSGAHACLPASTGLHCTCRPPPSPCLGLRSSLPNGSIRSSAATHQDVEALLSRGVPSASPPPPPPPALPGSVSAQALAPAADPPRYTFAPSASLNKTARPFGAPPPADSAPQQNGYVGPCPPAQPPTCPRLPAARCCSLHCALQSGQEPCGSDPWRPGWQALGPPRVWLPPLWGATDTAVPIPAASRLGSGVGWAS